MKFKTETISKLFRPGNRPAGVIISIAAIVLLFGCGHKDSGTLVAPPVRGQLVSWAPAAAFSEAFLNLGISALGITGVTATYGAACYKLTYVTPDTAGSLIHASGLVCLPLGGSGSRPVISYQHGTIFRDSDAPSRLTLSLSTSAEGLIGAVFAGLGFITVLPDYLGFGDSTGMLHPYLHAATLASATVDMNRAARTFFLMIGASSNGQLFLMGYSEGGYATIAVQRAMERDLSAEFTVTASEAGDGPYDLAGTAAYILALPNQPSPAFTGFFLKAYDSLYNHPSQIDYYFSPAFVPVVNTYFYGDFSRSQITAALGGSGVATTTLLNPAFVASFLDAGEVSLKSHIAENDVYDWAPAAPTRLFHGRDDEIVPYANATTAQTVMTNNGSTTVTIVDCYAGGLPTTHDNCIMPFAVDVIAFFTTQAAGL